MACVTILSTDTDLMLPPPTRPIYVSASFFIGAAVLMLMLPYETRGKQAL